MMVWIIIGFAVYIAVICTFLSWFFLYFLPGEGVGPLAVHYTLVEDEKDEHEEGHHGDEDSK